MLRDKQCPSSLEESGYSASTKVSCHPRCNLSIQLPPHCFDILRGQSLYRNFAETMAKVLSNGYINRNIQKGFLPATPGCTEHHCKLAGCWLMPDTATNHSFSAGWTWQMPMGVYTILILTLPSIYTMPPPNLRTWCPHSTLGLLLKSPHHIGALPLFPSR